MERIRKRERKEARRKEDDFRSEDNFKNDFEGLRNDYQNNFERDNFNMRHDPETGDYEIIYDDDPGDLYDQDKLKQMIKKKLTFVGLRHVFRRLKSNETFEGLRLPSYDILEKGFFFDQINLRFNEEGDLIGLSYHDYAYRKPANVIVRKPDPNNIQPLPELKFTTDKTSRNALNDFKARLSELYKEYKKSPSGMNEEIINENCFGVEDTSALDDEQIWEQDQISDRTRVEIFSDTEQIMQPFRDGILKKIEDIDKGDEFSKTVSGEKFYEKVFVATRKISDMDWYDEEAGAVSDKAPNEEFYEKELDIIDNLKKDIAERENNEVFEDKLEVYKDLKSYLDKLF